MGSPAIFADRSVVRRGLDRQWRTLRNIASLCGSTPSAVFPTLAAMMMDGEAEMRVDGERGRRVANYRSTRRLEEAEGDG